MEEHETNNEGKPFVPYQDLLQQLASGRNTQVDCVRFPIVDRSVTTQTQMGEILNAIDESLALQRPVYVHCFGGIGRTGTVVSCWLLRHDLARKDNVFEVAAWPAQSRRAEGFETCPRE